MAVVARGFVHLDPNRQQFPCRNGHPEPKSPYQFRLIDAGHGKYLREGYGEGRAEGSAEVGRGDA